jgi:hypothetical protein
MVPTVTEQNGSIAVTGFAPPSSHRAKLVTKDEVNELVDSGHALGVRGAHLDSAIPDKSVALWIGERFTEISAGIGLFPPALPPRKFNAAGGTFYFGLASKMFVYLDTWIGQAFERFRQAEDLELRAAIASLMQWTIPNRIETLAALWLAAKDPELELQRQFQLFGRGSTIENWKKSLEGFAQSFVYPFANLQIVAFTGATGTRRSEVFEDFVSVMRNYERALTADSYLNVVRKRSHLPLMLRLSQRKHRLMEIGQEAFEQSPLDLALSLPALKRKIETMPRTLIVDSVRHESVMEALKWLVPRNHFRMVAVSTTEHLRRQRLVERGEDPDKLRAHGTEKEIPDLSKHADWRIDGEVPYNDKLNDLAKQVVNG